MKILKSRSFWLVLSTVNVMSGLICAYSGSLEGALVCTLSLAACMISYHLSEFD